MISKRTAFSINANSFHVEINREEKYAEQKGARVIIQHSQNDYNTLNPAPEPNL